MELTLTLQNAAQLQRTFLKAPSVARVEYAKSLERIAVTVVSESQKLAPVGKYKGGGNLRQSIRYYPYGSSAFMVRVNANYGRYVEEGTRPHVIVPRTAKSLAFQKNGKWIFSKRVNHPGTKAQPYFAPAIKTAGTFANKEMSRAMDRVLNSLN